MSLTKIRSVLLSPLSIYLIRRAVILLVTVVIATFLTVLIANMGGYIDKMIYSLIKMQVVQSLRRDPSFASLPAAVREHIIEERIHEILHARGLDQPFYVRLFIYTWKALTLSLGQAYFIRSSTGSANILDIIMERLPWTVVLFITATLISAGIGIPLGLYVARRPGSALDKFVSIFAIVMQSLPAWFIGIFLILLFSYQIRLFPPGGVPVYSGPFWLWCLKVLYYMTLPLLSWVVTHFGYWAYITRNLVVSILSEDYVVAARARGIPESVILRRYVLRPASPTLITMIALAIVFALQGAIITETVFDWPGLGTLYYQAIEMLDAPVVIELTVVYAYILVATVFVLDIIYAVLDPRVRTGVR